MHTASSNPKWIFDSPLGLPKHNTSKVAGEKLVEDRRLAQIINSLIRIQAGAPGFEPGFTDPKSGVLPLHHAPMAPYPGWAG